MRLNQRLALNIVILSFAGFGQSAICAENKPEKSQEELEKLAEAGDVDAQFLVGKAYWHGRGVKKDQAKAVGYYRRAAEKNHADALAGLGAAYAVGQGVEGKDEGLAIDFFRKSAEQGSAIGQMNLGTMLITGRGAEKDTEEGLRWVTKAAEQGLLKAQSFLGESYFTGDYGIPRDLDQAINWVRKAAEQDCAPALNLYGVMLRDGLGVKSDPEGSLSYFQRAADQGSLKAYLNLGTAYFYGRGVEMDKVTGMTWWYCGEALGEGGCRETAQRLVIGINSDDVSKARERGNELARKRMPTYIKAKAKALKDANS